MNTKQNVSVAFLWASVFMCMASDQVEFRLIDVPGSMPAGFVWPSEIPEGCPFEQSKLFDRVYFSGRHGDYLCGDTFYPSWADDGNLYSPWTDGLTDGMRSNSRDTEKHYAATGHAIMKGDDPLQLTIKNTSKPKRAMAAPYQGRYPAGSLVHNGVWYFGTYCLAPGNPIHNEFSYNWPTLGSMPGFQISYDYGKTWEDSPLSAAKPLFPEPKEFLGTVKMGAPHFVDFGKNMEHSPNGKAYLLGMGAEENDPLPRPCITSAPGKPYAISEHCPEDTENYKHANLSWVSADQVYLSRVTPSPETMNDIKAYEFFAGHDGAGKPIWSKQFDDIKPLLEWNNNMGCVTATYVPGLKKYIMCVTDGWPTEADMSSYLLEADELTGPWRIITYMKGFGEQAYFLNIPSKFMSEDGKNTWLCYSANFSSGKNGYRLRLKPEGGRYGLSLHEIRFLEKDEPVPEPAKVAKADIFANNIAPQAQITVSSTHPDYSATALVDEVIAGYPENKGAEWSSDNENKGAWLKLEWATSKRIDCVTLFDRPYLWDQVLSGRLSFSDGSVIEVNHKLPTSAIQGLEINFPLKDVTWIKFEIMETRKWQGFLVQDEIRKTPCTGLAEIAVFE
ncbi:DUF7402 domain-containing protein [Pontiella sulfatireligans]|uniref:DUF7402 domain-containing protein n=1 Tax=Pontiella sulfatireligans TaxID=2750658 RepID=A0A6C2UJX3_9BACT|nr:hypothetical protein [Pontiella sulfatireligans]VGO20398.1 hypothetical protein SCARR_02461 [Pontiella sulfatireligans]